MGSLARHRRLHIMLGRDPWERWDALEAMRPVGFATAGAYVSGSSAPAVPVDELVFREEREYADWNGYAWDAWGHPHVSELYSPWQLLYLSDVVEGERADLPVDVLLDERKRSNWVASIASILESRRNAWCQLDRQWQPLMKLLVRVQNRYWPPVRGTVNLLHDEQGRLVDPGEEERRAGDPQVVLDELGLADSDIVEMHHFLCHRGLRLEPGDGWSLLRQMVPRRRRQRFGGTVRRAQDHYDAAAVLRRFYRDLREDVLPDCEGAVEGEEFRERRRRLLGHAATMSYDQEDVKQTLLAVGLYPHGLHVIVEGQTEERVVRSIVRGALGPAVADDLLVDNLHGVGEAKRIGTVLAAVAEYALRPVLIVDREGEMQRAVDRLIADGSVDPADVLVFDRSFEEDNFSDEELVRIAAELALDPPGGRDSVDMTLDASTLREEHTDRLRRSSAGHQPGLANTLQVLSSQPEHGGARFSKLELADALVHRLEAELKGTTGEEALERVLKSRPILRHIYHRILDPLAQMPADQLLRSRRRNRNP